jgi:hypothetical protein
MTEPMFNVTVVKGNEASQEIRNLEAGISKRTTRRMYTASLILTRTIRRIVTGTRVFKGSDARVRTGKFAQAWQTIPVATRGNDVVAGAFSSHPGAAIQEYGGDIVPKNAKALTIPLDAEAARARAGDFDLELRIFKRETGGVIGKLVEKSDPDKARYLLLKKVRIKAKNYLTAALAEATPEIGDQIDQGVKDELAAFGARP